MEGRPRLCAGESCSGVVSSFFICACELMQSRWRPLSHMPRCRDRAHLWGHQRVDGVGEADAALLPEIVVELPQVAPLLRQVHLRDILRCCFSLWHQLQCCENMPGNAADARPAGVRLPAAVAAGWQPSRPVKRPSNTPAPAAAQQTGAGCPAAAAASWTETAPPAAPRPSSARSRARWPARPPGAAPAHSHSNLRTLLEVWTCSNLYRSCGDHQQQLEVA